ncbi:MAG TPA: hypothetical protein DHU96_21925 [Actinobacteria bacterium]|nr:hypothetical protein [Actinomycetota bacterium]
MLVMGQRCGACPGHGSGSESQTGCRPARRAQARGETPRPRCTPRGVVHGGSDRLLAAFLAGDLDPAVARRWKEHLRECERCRHAVREDRDGRRAARLLRRPAPPGLAARVCFAVEMAAAGRAAAPWQAGAG